jgi:hypothetical protein
MQERRGVPEEGLEGPLGTEVCVCMVECILGVLKGSGSCSRLKFRGVQGCTSWIVRA